MLTTRPVIALFSPSPRSPCPWCFYLISCGSPGVQRAQRPHTDFGACLFPPNASCTHDLTTLHQLWLSSYDSSVGKLGDSSWYLLNIYPQALWSVLHMYFRIQPLSESKSCVLLYMHFAKEDTEAERGWVTVQSRGVKGWQSHHLSATGLVLEPTCPNCAPYRLIDDKWQFTFYSSAVRAHFHPVSTFLGRNHPSKGPILPRRI